MSDTDDKGKDKDRDKDQPRSGSKDRGIETRMSGGDSSQGPSSSDAGKHGVSESSVSSAWGGCGDQTTKSETKTPDGGTDKTTTTQKQDGTVVTSTDHFDAKGDFTGSTTVTQTTDLGKGTITTGSVNKDANGKETSSEHNVAQYTDGTWSDTTSRTEPAKQSGDSTGRTPEKTGGDAAPFSGHANAKGGDEKAKGGGEKVGEQGRIVNAFRDAEGNLHTVRETPSGGTVESWQVKRGGELHTISISKDKDGKVTGSSDSWQARDANGVMHSYKNEFDAKDRLTKQTDTFRGEDKNVHHKTVEYDGKEGTRVSDSWTDKGRWHVDSKYFQGKDLDKHMTEHITISPDKQGNSHLVTEKFDRNGNKIETSDRWQTRGTDGKFHEHEKTERLSR
ncbi:hypothetical protein [Streptomyces sp. NPDC127084]|uniref:hypothetical protein n=1 Tax=Streptomyces sp. NPDC127084 TaxID=3347133 RepID=UPI00364BE23A